MNKLYVICGYSCCRVLYYRYKFLTNERFDNRFINKDFRNIDIRRAQMGKETILPLNKRERNIYIIVRKYQTLLFVKEQLFSQVGSLKLVKKERIKLTESAVALSMASLKLASHMAMDYSLFWVLTLIRIHASFQSKFDGKFDVFTQNIICFNIAYQTDTDFEFISKIKIYDKTRFLLFQACNVFRKVRIERDYYL